MNLGAMILLIMGIFYVIIGGGVSIAFMSGPGSFGFMMAIPLLFVVLGVCFIVGVIVVTAKQHAPRRKGTKYAAKIYGYVQNRSVTVNGAFLVNTKVHYFDNNHVEREAILSTNFAQGSNMYPIGMTIDIYEYQGKYDFDKASVRSEVLPDEMYLMDDKPVAPDQVHIVAVVCPNCGSTFQASSGYANQCPYCSSHINVGAKNNF